MPSPNAPPIPVERTPEQHAAVRRRSTPIALGGVICGVGAIVMLLSRSVNHSLPPNIFAMNLSFCAMLMGLGILFYVKGTPGARVAIGLSLAALLSGLVGPLVFAKQSLDWRVALETHELDNVRAIVTASKSYAHSHDGHFPASLEVLLHDHLLTPDDLHSPFGNAETIDQRDRVAKAKQTQEQFDEWYARHSDYEYFGGDLTESVIAAATRPTATAPAAPADFASQLIIAASTDVIMSSKLTASFLDGHADYIDLEQAEAALKATNAARAAMSLPPLHAPDAIERAHELEKHPLSE